MFLASYYICLYGILYYLYGMRSLFTIQFQPTDQYKPENIKEYAGDQSLIRLIQLISMNGIGIGFLVLRLGPCHQKF